jgi:hypothetical protein
VKIDRRLSAAVLFTVPAAWTATSLSVIFLYTRVLHQRDVPEFAGLGSLLGPLAVFVFVSPALIFAFKEKRGKLRLSLVCVNLVGLVAAVYCAGIWARFDSDKVGPRAHGYSTSKTPKQQE